MKTTIFLLFFSIMAPFQLTAEIRTVSLSQYAIRVSGDIPQLCSKAAFICDEYMEFLKNTLGKEALLHLKYPLSIHLLSPSDSKTNTHFKTQKTLVVQTHTEDWIRLLTKHIGIYYLNASYELPASQETKIPLFLPNGLSELYWRQKNVLQNVSAYSSLSEGICIPYDIILSATNEFEPPLMPLFEVQSLFVIQCLIAHPSPAENIKKYITAFQNDSNTAISFLLKTVGFSSISQLQETISRRITDNMFPFRLAASLDTSSEKEVEKFLDGILTFSFPNPNEKRHNSIFRLENQGSSRIIVKANDVKLYDLPYIAPSQIEGKIIILKMLLESCTDPWNTRISYYIEAFNNLKAGNFEQYYDYLYQASK
ncbi:MAG: hypothetical protein H7A34_05780 [bacterium]|nr:hypothetical protein [bacterium]